MTSIRFLSKASLESIHQASLKIIEKTGIRVKNDLALSILKENGCTVESEQVYIPSSLVDDLVKRTPSKFTLYDREGENSFTIGSDSVLFNPGSSSIYVKDRESRIIRKGTKKDLVELTVVVNSLKHIKGQSTALIPSDVPVAISDFYRLYILLKYSSKPIITGAFRKEGLDDMKKLLEIFAGGQEELTRKPRAIFDCCPISPLVWSDTTCQNLLDCAASGIPAEIVPAPLMGATSPITINGTIIQSNVEILSGIVMAQLLNPGTPIVYGCAVAGFDMKYATTRFGAVESMIAACASSEIGKHYGIPTHAYLGSSDSKIEDAQSGYESGLSLALGALARINVISGPGMLAQLNCQSLEKLVIDNELCGSAYRLIEGVDVDDLNIIPELLEAVSPGGDFLRQKHTSKRFRSEHFVPSSVICRLTVDRWLAEGSKNALDRANERVNAILKDYSYQPTEHDKELESVFGQLLKKYEAQSQSD
jgi:trimethylamine--corrinoid protein Co-methyltransferase